MNEKLEYRLDDLDDRINLGQTYAGQYKRTAKIAVAVAVVALCLAPFLDGALAIAALAAGFAFWEYKEAQQQLDDQLRHIRLRDRLRGINVYGSQQVDGYYVNAMRPQPSLAGELKTKAISYAKQQIQNRKLKEITR